MESRQIIDNIWCFHKLMKKLFHSIASSSIDLPINKTQEKILMFIKHHKENTMGDISIRVGLEKGSFTTATDKLIEEDLVRRIRSESDRRKICLALTKKGEGITSQIMNFLDRHFEQKLNILSDEEKKEFLNALEIVNKYAEKI